MPSPDPANPARFPSLLMDVLLAEHVSHAQPRLDLLWRYYRNPAPSHAQAGGGQAARLSAQARGLPARLQSFSSAQPREVVIENDIAWRIHTLVDFMFGKPLVIQSLADDPAQRTAITRLLRDTFRANGGEGFFHDLEHQPFLGRVLRKARQPLRKTVERTEIWTPEGFETFVATKAVTGKRQTRIDAGINRLGRLPVVHIQNLAQPFFYEGLSDVEALIPLQDELNTRLSDRANRVTFQSFKMYLGKGIDGFTDRPVGPGQMWSTDNPDASIHEFGGDDSTPSEDQHIREIREAMDKASGVSPIAAGVVGGKTGNLSSENAIRIVLLGLLARIEKKRLTYGNGLEQLCELILHAADVTGQLRSAPADRRVRLDWPTPFPDSEAQQLKNALTKKELGVPAEQLLAELGYGECAGHA